MPRLLFIFVLLAQPLLSSAQRLLRQPLSYVPPQNICVLPHDQDNIILDIMAINQFLTPRAIAVSAADRKMAVKAVRKNKGKEGLGKPVEGFSAEQSFLLTAQPVAFDSIENRYFNELPRIIRNEALPLGERERAAQDFLDCTGIVLATDGATGVYVNLYENCTALVATPRLSLTLDIISEYPEGPEVKFRVGGLKPGQTEFALRIRLQDPDRIPTFYINGRPIPSPVVEDGYLVVNRKWRNHEEVFFYTDSPGLP